MTFYYGTEQCITLPNCTSPPPIHFGHGFHMYIQPPFFSLLSLSIRFPYSLIKMLRICSSIVFLLFIGYNFIYVLAAPLEHRALGVRRHHKESKKKRYFEGSGTHYDTSAGVGSCGEFDSNDDSVVALNSAEMNNGIIL